MLWGRLRSDWGTFYAAWEEEGLRALLFPNQSPPEVAMRRSPLLAELERQLNAYFQGERRAFSLPLVLRGTPFQLAVWKALLEVPYGQVVSYGELASMIGRPRAARAVGGAVSANPIPIVIPCHRVIAAHGGLGGFGPGLNWKAKLLSLEKGGLK